MHTVEGEVAMYQMSKVQQEALERLLGHAERDSGQSRRVADFLLAWWNAGSCGKFDITTARGMDDEIVDDVVTVFDLAVRCNVYADAPGYGPQFEAVVREWRPKLGTTS
jgi:hypothetical protein